MFPFFHKYIKIFDEENNIVRTMTLFSERFGGLMIMDIFWNIFEKSGSIDAFMAHKEYERSCGEMMREKTESIADGFVTGENLWIR